ncbi:cytochrome c [Phototrophicus methaneseepsis]|uniref:Cytochrome c n=2 Tax=Phototrophicus methaneseepsis TaxID=2710758 RepID=A0A7S8IFU9_9CHLR|nr:cytochrome c [Phototrophicus methaneseepsis]
MLPKSLLCGLLALLLAACSIQSDLDRFIATNPDAYELGQRVYGQNCAACHGANGQGQFPENPRARDASGRYGAPPHDDNGHTWHHDDDLLYQIVREGGMGNPEDFNPMPAFGERLSDEEIEAVIFYIKTFWTEEQRQNQQEATDVVRNQSQ